MFTKLDKQTHEKIKFVRHPLSNVGNESDQVVDRKDHVRLLSYNLFLRPFVKNVQNDWKDERLHAYVQMLEDYDIICNQEVFDFFNKNRKERLISHCIKAGFVYYACSPPAPLFSEYALSGGLVTFSRFPIIEADFKPYRYGVLSDQISYKGVLYCKIDVAGAILHVFQTHTQASYFGTSAEDFTVTFECRYEQLKIIRMFIEEKTKDAQPDELIILCGDINVNGAKVDRKGQTYRELVKEKPEFKAALDQYDKEYSLLIDTLSKNQEDLLIDVMREANSGCSPVTFGDCYRDEDGIEHPMETQLVKPEDYCTQQSLDYIFEIRRSFNLKKTKEQIMSDNISTSSPQRNIQEHQTIEFLKCQQHHDNKNTNTITNKQEQSSQRKRLKINIKESKVEKFLFDTHPLVKQCSDHYGVSTILNIV